MTTKWIKAICRKHPLQMIRANALVMARAHSVKTWKDLVHLLCHGWWQSIARGHSLCSACSVSVAVGGRAFPKPILGCDNYPCCSPLPHLHNQHQSFTVEAQRNITRQKKKQWTFQMPAQGSCISPILLVPNTNVLNSQTSQTWMKQINKQINILFSLKTFNLIESLVPVYKIALLIARWFWFWNQKEDSGIDKQDFWVIHNTSHPFEVSEKTGPQIKPSGKKKIKKKSR